MLINKIILFFLNAFAVAFVLAALVFLVMIFEGFRTTGELIISPRIGKEVVIIGLAVGFSAAFFIQILLWRQTSVSLFFIALASFLLIETYYIDVSIPVWTSLYFRSYDAAFALGGLWGVLYIQFVFCLFAAGAGAVNKFLINRLITRKTLV